MSEQSNNPGLQIRLPLLFAITLAAGMFIGRQLPRSGSHFSQKSEISAGSGSVLDEIMQYVDARYVDTVNMETIKNTAIQQVLDQLDPHSIYISPEEAQSVEDDMNGSFEGVGIEFIMLDDTIQVITPMSGGPSETAGILAGDKLVTINDTIIAGKKVDNGTIYKKLRGPKGSPVRLGILRGKETALRQITVIRDKIAIQSIETAYMIDEKTGYVKVNQFTSKTYTEFMEAIRPMAEEKGMTNLLLDLRGNPGGYLEEATQMLSQFFPEHKLLVYTEGRTDSRQEYKSSGRARFNIQNVAVLIDEGSASASEIVAGAIQDHDRGWIIGRRSFGKGLVQEEYPLSNQGRLRLTVARYYTPSGRCIQRPYKNNNHYNNEESLRLTSGELTDISKIKIEDTTHYYTGMGRLVYSGGGILPDIFVPLDTSYFSPYFTEANRLMPQFLSRWMEVHGREALPATAEAMLSYQTDDKIIADFVEYLQKQGIAKNDAQLSRCRQEIKLRLKARMAHILFNEETQFRILNADDPAVEKAVKILRSGEPVAKR